MEWRPREERDTSAADPSAARPTAAPEVSVVVAAFNAGRTITETLQSLFAQTYRNFEVIVVDDGSSDDTALRVADFGHRLRSIEQRNAGRASARNAGIRDARGRLIAFLDAGDVWLPRKLQRQVAYFERFPDTILLHSARLVSHTPAPTLRETADALPIDTGLEPPRHVFGDLFHGGVEIDAITVMVRSDAIAAAGGFDERRDLQVEEWDLWLRIAALRPVGYIAYPLAVRRAGTPSHDVEKTFNGQRIVIQKMARLCGTACSRHPGDGNACIDARLAQLFSEVGHERFWAGQMGAIRDALPGLARRRHEPRHARPRADGGVRADIPPRENLVHDTVFRRTRRSFAQAAHTLDDLAYRATHSRARLLFEATSPMSLAVGRPVLDRLRRDPRIELWFTTSDAQWDRTRIFAAAGIDRRVISPDDARWMKFDAYVNTDFWNMTWLRRRTRRLHLFHGVAGKYGLDAPTRIAPCVASFDRLLFPNRDRLRRYAEAGLVDPDSAQAALVGYPKVDCLVDGSLNRRAIERSLGLDESVPTVLYAPTWSPYSSLHTVGEELIAALARLGVNVVVKLHDRSCDQSARGAGGVDWRSTIERLAQRWPVVLAPDADASPYLFAADLDDHRSQLGGIRVHAARSADRRDRLSEADRKGACEQRQSSAAAQRGRCRPDRRSGRASSERRTRTPGTAQRPASVHRPRALPLPRYRHGARDGVRVRAVVAASPARAE